jgi:hypothetical protein
VINSQHNPYVGLFTCINEASLVGESNYESRNEKGINAVHFGQELVDNTIPGNTGVTLIAARATAATTGASHGIKFIHDNYMQSCS